MALGKVKLLLIAAMALFVFTTALAEEYRKVPVSELKKIEDHVKGLQAMVDELTDALAEEKLESENLRFDLLTAQEKERKSNRGLWLGGGLGLPFPTVAGSIQYQLSERVAPIVYYGWNGKPFAAIGLNVRVGK